MSAPLANIALGGYFSLELGAGNPLPHLGIATKYQSARTAMAAVLGAMRPRTVWLPHYICGAVIETLASINLRVQRYVLTEERGVPENLAVDTNDALICVDYFGISGNTCDAAIAHYGRERVLVDASQSLFHTPRKNVATVYSPRKFVGVPDGGLLVTHHMLPSPSPAPADEAASIARSMHLLTRASGQILEGYSQFQDAEASLRDPESQAMSVLTTCMLAATDFDRVRRRRIANFKSLSATLRSLGFNTPDLPNDAVPMCCPVSDVEGKWLQRKLTAQDIFTPVYWVDTVLPENDKIGHMLRDRTVYLPCDQRYGAQEMARIAGALAKIKEST